MGSRSLNGEGYGATIDSVGNCCVRGVEGVMSLKRLAFWYIISQIIIHIFTWLFRAWAVWTMEPWIITSVWVFCILFQWVNEVGAFIYLKRKYGWTWKKTREYCSVTWTEFRYKLSRKLRGLNDETISITETVEK
jgi:hypothetical protein